MDHDMITDMTLDHLPDLSEASVSFQIPSNNPSADLLLADHTDGFDVLCSAIDDDASFAPLAPRNPRGPPLMLSELTPMAEATSRASPCLQSPTPTHVPSSSAKPSVIQLTLRRRTRSPDKRGKTPSRAKSIRPQLESPLVSSERFDKLRAELETFGQADGASSRVQIHAMESVEKSSVECKNPLRAESKLKNVALDSPPTIEHRLDCVPKEKGAGQDVEIQVNPDVVMATDKNCPADTTDITVPPPRPESKRNPRTTAKPTIAATGISNRSVRPATHVSKKAKSKPSRVQEAQPVPPFTARQITPPQSIANDPEGQLVPPAYTSGDIDSKSENTQITHPDTGGMAERLVSYSQRLVSSIGLYKPWSDPSVQVPDHATRMANARVGAHPVTDAQPPSPPPQFINDIPSTHETRLSEKLPHKSPPHSPQPRFAANTGIPQDGRQHAMSPMRPARKRISTDTDLPQEQYRRSKRGKIMLTDVNSVRGSSNRTVSQAQARLDKTSGDIQSVAHSEPRDSVHHLQSCKSTLPSARTKYKPKFDTSARCKGPTLDAFPYLSCSRQVVETVDRSKSKRDEGRSKAQNSRTGSSLSGLSASSRLRQDKRTRRGGGVNSSHVRQPPGPTTSADLPLGEKKQNATLFVAPPTKPAGFTFRVDARLEARKAEERLAVSEPGKTHPHHAVPDLKPFRASHQAAFLFHQENVVPSVPVVPFVFCTEQRAKEREKFDAMMKHKEEEMQRLKEEQRRRDAEEEERTIKELRRKAIPKANEIPEWYAGMPKRKGRRCEIDGEEGTDGGLAMA